MDRKMADIVTGTVTGQVNVGEILRDIGTVRREAAINEGVTSMNVKDGTDTSRTKRSPSTSLRSKPTFRTRRLSPL